MDNEAGISEPKPSSPEVTYPKTWQEIRGYWESTNYSEIYESAMKRFKEWEAFPRVSIEPAEWNSKIYEQIKDAEQMLTGYNNPQASMLRTNKLVAMGKDRPKSGQENLTRLYLGIDPRRATDAYKALLAELSSRGCLKDVEVALNLEELEGRRLVGNTIVIYEPLSRPETLNKILEAYQAAKTNASAAFALSPRQKAAVMRENLRQFKATIDANLSFVEIPKEEEGRSFDTGGAKEIHDAFGLPWGECTDEEWLKRVQEREKTGIVLVNSDKDRLRNGLTKPGDVLHYRRKLSTPALVNYGIVTLQ